MAKKKQNSSKKFSFWFLVLLTIILLVLVLKAGSGYIANTNDKSKFKKVEQGVLAVRNNLEKNRTQPATVDRSCQQAVEKYGGGYWVCSSGINSANHTSLDVFNSDLQNFRNSILGSAHFHSEKIIEENNDDSQKHVRYSYYSVATNKECGLTAIYSDAQKVISFGCQMRVSKPLF